MTLKSLKIIYLIFCSIIGYSKVSKFCSKNAICVLKLLNFSKLYSIFMVLFFCAETLEFLATTKGLETILKIFPEDKYLIDTNMFAKSSSRNSNEFDDYLRLCVDKERSEKIKQMITNTGYQLWDAINK